MLVSYPYYSNRYYIMPYILNMTEILRYWRDLSKEQKQEIKSKYGIKVMTYKDIKNIYNEKHK